MAQVQAVAVASDRVMATLIMGLELEFGEGVDRALARRFMEAEEGDFLWDARQSECWLGSYDDVDGEAGEELDRVAIVGRLDGEWFVATAIVDGDGNARDLVGRRTFGSERRARAAFVAKR